MEEEDMSGLVLLSNMADLVARNQAILGQGDVEESNNFVTYRPETTDGEEETKPPSADMPDEYKTMIQLMGGEDTVLVIEKRLSQTDLKNHNSRLSIPVKQIQGNFLKPKEEEDLDAKKTIEVQFLEPRLSITTLVLRKWTMGASVTYNLTTNWNSVVNNKSNGLHVNDLVQLWSFRHQSRLCFALVKVSNKPN